jgi:hypothetical protein
MCDVKQKFQDVESVFVKTPSTKLKYSKRFDVPGTDLCILMYENCTNVSTGTEYVRNYFGIKSVSQKTQPTVLFDEWIEPHDFRTYVYTSDNYVMTNLLLAAVQGYRLGIWEGQINIFCYTMDRILSNHMVNNTKHNNNKAIVKTEYSTFPDFLNPVEYNNFWLNTRLFLLFDESKTILKVQIVGTRIHVNKQSWLLHDYDNLTSKLCHNISYMIGDDNMCPISTCYSTTRKNEDKNLFFVHRMYRKCTDKGRKIYQSLNRYFPENKM